nr:hypothetical protein [Tanacetum cinerariifolium]
MARLAFYDYDNMITILEKSEHNGEGSGTPTESHYIPSPQVQQSLHHDSSSPLHPTASTKTIPTTTPIEIPTLRQYSRRATRIAQSKALPTDADEPASLLRDDSQGEAFPTVFGLDVGQDRENIIKTSALPHESTPRVTSLDADEGGEEYGDRRGSRSREKHRMRNVPLVAGVSTVGVPTVSGLVPTVSAIFTTASVVTPYSRRPREILAKDKEEELKMLIDGLDRSNEVIAKHLQKYEQSKAKLTIGEKIELINEQRKSEKSLFLYGSKLKTLCIWLKEEGERVKRKGLKLEQGSAKKMKTFEEVSKEDLKEMMQLVPVEEVYVEALQVKHPIIDWEIHSEGQRDYWKIIKLGGHTAVYQFFIDMLKQFDREDLN